MTVKFSDNKGFFAPMRFEAQVDDCVVEGELPPGRGVTYAIDRALGTLSQHIDYVIIKQLVGHETSFHLVTVLPPTRTVGTRRVLLVTWSGG